jgi:hypothetical protein
MGSMGELTRPAAIEGEILSTEVSYHEDFVLFCEKVLVLVESVGESSITETASVDQQSVTEVRERWRNPNGKFRPWKLGEDPLP